MSTILRVKVFIFVISESLLLSVAKVYWLVFILDTRSTWQFGANALFSIHTVLVLAHWYCFAICESGDLFVNNGPYLSATGIEKLFSTIKLVMRTSALKILIVNGSFCGTKLRVDSCRSDGILSLCVLNSQYMSLYISFTLMSTTKFTRTNHT